MNKVNFENSNYNRKGDLSELVNALENATEKFERSVKSVNDDVTRLESDIEKKRLNIEKLEDVEKKLSLKEDELDKLKESTKTAIQELENRKKNVDYEDSDLQNMEIEDLDSLIQIKRNKINKIDSKINSNKEKIRTNDGNLKSSRRELDRLLEEKEISEDSLLRTNDLLDVVNKFRSDFMMKIQSIVERKYDVAHPEEEIKKEENKEEKLSNFEIKPNEDFEAISLAENEPKEEPSNEAKKEEVKDEEPKEELKEESLEETPEKEEKEETKETETSKEEPQEEEKEEKPAEEETEEPEISLDIDSDIKNNLEPEQTEEEEDKESEEEEKPSALIEPSDEEPLEENKIDVPTEEPTNEVEHVELKASEKLPDETPEKEESSDDAKPWNVKPIGEGNEEKLSFLKGTFDKEDISFDEFAQQDQAKMEENSDRVAKNLMILKKHNIPLKYTKNQANIYYDISPQDLEDLLNIITETQERNGMDFDIEYTYHILGELGKTDVDKLIDVYNTEFMNINSKSGIIGLLKKTDPNVGDFSENRKANEKTLSQLGIRKVQEISDGYPDFINLDHPLFESIIDLFDKDDLIEKLNSDISVIPQILDYWKNN